ncbi:MAG: DUF975 family protein [Oscillospiraceae bacterium]|nr:DUF975 family protein [Oscillospiraceae bacterium]
MNIRNRREIKSFAAQRLEGHPSIRRILLIYAAVTLGLSALGTITSYLLGLQMEGLGGLSNMGRKTMLSSIQSLLPTAISLVTLCVEVGLLAAMMRVARGQYVSEKTLKLGFDRFWLLLRAGLFQIFMYMGALFMSVYLGIMLFMLSPLSDPAVEILTPYLTEMSILSGGTPVLDDAAYAQFTQAVWPAYLFCGVIFALSALPLFYTYRMTNYIIVDKPGIGALAALHMSKQIMRGNRLALLKLDLSMWWYYLALLIAQVVCYGDVILSLLGVTLPGNGDIWYFVFLGAYFAVLFSIYYFLRSRVEVSYALVYDSVKPEEPKNEGVVLGNIFQM